MPSPTFDSSARQARARGDLVDSVTADHVADVIEIWKFANRAVEEDSHGALVRRRGSAMQSGGRLTGVLGVGRRAKRCEKEKRRGSGVGDGRGRASRHQRKEGGGRGPRGRRVQFWL